MRSKSTTFIKHICRSILYLYLLFVLSPKLVYAQEICNNGIDDDLNGFIDDFDSACFQDDPSCGIPVKPKLPSDFIPAISCTFQERVVPYAAPMVGDVDADGEVEIVTLTSGNNGGVVIVNGNNCEEEAFFPLNANVGPRAGNLVLGDVDQDGFIDIFATSTSTDLHRIEFDGIAYRLQWIVEGVATADRPHLDIVDLNQDGQAEIIPNQGYMVNGETGVIYPDPVPPLERLGKGLFAFTADADLGNNGNEGEVELIRGSEIYRYDFVANNWNLIRTLPGFYQDEDWHENTNTALADMDLDGDVDAVVNSHSEGQMIIWDLQTTEIFFGGLQAILPGDLGGRPTIGNFDNDPLPEIAICSQLFLSMYDDVANGEYQLLWSTRTNDESGHTQTTAFDFDGDDKLELVYRDTDKLRVFLGEGNGNNGPLELFSTGPLTCLSETGMEYPTIADVNGDGQANIITSCLGKLSVFQSASFPWMPARSVWNTQAYAITNVNEDGTIPAHFQENYLVYNNFLNQSSSLVPDSSSLIPASDFTLSLLTDQGQEGILKSNCPEEGSVIVEICNEGATANVRPVYFAIYEHDPFLNFPPADLLVADSIMITINPGICFIDTLKIPIREGDYTILINHNHDQLSFPLATDTVNSVEDECDYLDNVLFVPSISCQELCNNGLDDDGDGWIDIQDPDCTVEEGSCPHLSEDNAFPDGDFGTADSGGTVPPSNPSIIISALNGIESDYTFGIGLDSYPPTAHYVLANSTQGMNFSTYLSATTGNTESSWISLSESTSDSTGNMMIVNGDTTTSIILSQTTTAVCGGLTYQISFEVVNLLSPLIVPHGMDNPFDSTSLLPELDVIIGPEGTENETALVLPATFSTGEIRNTGQWNTFSFTFQAPENIENFRLFLRSKASEVGQDGRKISNGNDFAIDNIRVSPCLAEVSIFSQTQFPICNGDSIFISSTISGNSDFNAYQWQIRSDTSSTWENLNEAQSSNLTLTSLDYRREVRVIVARNERELLHSHCSQVSDPLVIQAVSAIPLSVSNDTTICLGDTIELEASSEDDVSYRWTDEFGNISSNERYLSVSPSLNTDFFVEAQNELECTNSDTVSIGISTSNVQLMALGDTLVCQGDSVELIASGGTRYQWLPSESLSDPSIANPIASPLETTSYLVSIINEEGCESLKTINILVVEPNLEAITRDTIICKGESLTLGIENGGERYRWSTGQIASGITVYPIESAQYWVLPSVLSACSNDTMYIDITVAERPIAIFSIDTSQGVQPFTVQFQNQSKFATEAIWDFGDGFSSTSYDPIHTYQADGSYEVKLSVSGLGGCQDSVHGQFIEVIPPTIYLPNAFTPNDDGHNDKFHFSISGIRDISISIFDKWGKLIVTSFQPDFSWDGTLNDHSLPEGVYVITIQGNFMNGKPFKQASTISLIR